MLHPVAKTMRWVEKNDCTIMQTLGQIDQCAPGIGLKIWHLYIISLHAGLQRSRTLPVLNLLRGRKSITIFVPQGRYVTPIHVKSKPHVNFT